MKEYRVKSFAELHEALGHHRRDAGWVYRGHADQDWPLIPRAGRPPFADGHDQIFFKRWKAEALQHVEPDERPADDWNWLAIAQHHGFATRLMDWTAKPLAAAYFAVMEPGYGESVIWAFKTTNILSDLTAKTPFERQGISQFTPTRVSGRVSRVIGLFTHHGPSTLSVDAGMTPADKLEKIVIHQDYRAELLFELNQYGINGQTLFPNLVGLSRHFNWIMAEFDYWKAGLSGINKS